jgi:cytochrome c oxidase subunit 3
MSEAAGGADQTTAAPQHHEERPEHAHHFETPDQQFASGKLGIWVFLATEILLFGGLFCAYAVYRALHPEVFVYASLFLDRVLGGINTVVLICSSLTMAWAVRAAQLGQRRLLMLMLSLTIVGGFGFMGIKYVEYEHKWKEGLLWGTSYVSQADGHAFQHGEEGAAAHGDEAAAEGAAAGEGASTEGGEAAPAESAPAPSAPAPAASDNPDRPLIPLAAEGPSGLAQPQEEETVQDLAAAEPKNVHLFFGIYFAMTGLHAVHVIVGMILIGYILFFSAKGLYGPKYFTPVDVVGLYWHLVDLIWIFLFPLLYLID